SSKIDSTRLKTTKSVLDGFGRTTQFQVMSDPNGISFTDTTYDKIGRIASRSNPYYTTADPTYGITSYSYDALNRPTVVTRPGGATVLTDYTKRATRVQDEGNGSVRLSKIYQKDALGRLTSVCEVTSATQQGIPADQNPSPCNLDIAGTGFLTTHQYDTLDNLTTVTQGSLPNRTYVYDMLSRLTSENNPESGTTTYT